MDDGRRWHKTRTSLPRCAIQLYLRVSRRGAFEPQKWKRGNLWKPKFTAFFCFSVWAVYILRQIYAKLTQAYAEVLCLNCLPGCFRKFFVLPASLKKIHGYAKCLRRLRNHDHFQVLRLRTLIPVPFSL